MALAETLGVDKLSIAGKLSDAQVAMDDTALNADLVSIFDTALAEKSLAIKDGSSLYKAFSRALRKFILEADTQPAS